MVAIILSRREHLGILEQAVDVYTSEIERFLGFIRYYSFLLQFQYVWSFLGTLKAHNGLYLMDTFLSIIDLNILNRTWNSIMCF